MDERKRGERRYVKDLTVNQEAYVISSAISYDTDHRRWLDKDAPVRKGFGGAFKIKVVRREDGYEVAIPQEYNNHNFEIQSSQALSALASYVCLDENVDPIVLKKVKLPSPLSPLESVFLEPELYDEILLHMGIIELLEGRNPEYSGTIFYGPPGTGKTVLQRKFREVYENCGANTFESNEAEMMDVWVSSYARNLNALCKKALETAQKTKRVSLITFDEGSSLVTDGNIGAESASGRYYNEGLDTFKRYIGNYRELTFNITTNLNSQLLDSAMVRDGRLKPFFIDYPSLKTKEKMWAYFLKNHHDLELESNEIRQLAEATPREHGASIEEFSRTYALRKRVDVAKRNNSSSLMELLLKGQKLPSQEEIRSKMNFFTLLQDVRKHNWTKEK